MRWGEINWEGKNNHESEQEGQGSCRDVKGTVHPKNENCHHLLILMSFHFHWLSSSQHTRFFLKNCFCPYKESQWVPKPNDIGTPLTFYQTILDHIDFHCIDEKTETFFKIFSFAFHWFWTTWRVSKWWQFVWFALLRVTKGMYLLQERNKVNHRKCDLYIYCN